MIQSPFLLKMSRCSLSALILAWVCDASDFRNSHARASIELQAPLTVAQSSPSNPSASLTLPWVTLFEQERKTLKGGSILYQRFENLDKEDAEGARSVSLNAKQIVHIVTIQLKNKPISLSISSESDKGLTPSELHFRQKALVTVNGSFFDEKNQALGLTISDGKRWKHTQDTNSYSFFACSKELECLIEPSAKVEIHKHGSRSTKNSVFNGSSVYFQAVSGRPRLVDAGIPRSKIQDQKCSQFCEKRHPRVGLGLSQNREILYIALAEGRQSQAQGCSLAEFSTILQFVGAFDAINLDGGGSATLLIEGKRVSGRPNNEPLERPVANAISIQ